MTIDEIKAAEGMMNTVIAMVVRGRVKLTDERTIQALRDEAGEAGDLEMVAACGRMLSGEASEADMESIAETIRYAAERAAEEDGEWPH